MVVLTAVKAYGPALKHASTKLRGDRDVVLTAMAQDGEALKFASLELRADREMVLKEVAQNGAVLEHASEDLQADRAVVLTSVEQNGAALEHASPKLQADRAVVLTAVAQYGAALEHASEYLQADRAVVLTSVEQNGAALEYVSPKLQADRAVVLTAVAQNGWALQHASPALRGDRKVVLTVLAQNGRALYYASPESKKQFFKPQKTSITQSRSTPPGEMYFTPDGSIGFRVSTLQTSSEGNDKKKLILKVTDKTDPEGLRYACKGFSQARFDYTILLNASRSLSQKEFITLSDHVLKTMIAGATQTHGSDISLYNDFPPEGHYFINIDDLPLDMLGKNALKARASQGKSSPFKEYVQDFDPKKPRITISNIEGIHPAHEILSVCQGQSREEGFMWVELGEQNLHPITPQKFSRFSREEKHYYPGFCVPAKSIKMIPSFMEQRKGSPIVPDLFYLSQKNSDLMFHRSAASGLFYIENPTSENVSADISYLENCRATFPLATEEKPKMVSKFIAQCLGSINTIKGKPKIKGVFTFLNEIADGGLSKEKTLTKIIEFFNSFPLEKKELPKEAEKMGEDIKSLVFKNARCETRCMLAIRLWQSLYPGENDLLCASSDIHGRLLYRGMVYDLGGWAVQNLTVLPSATLQLERKKAPGGSPMRSSEVEIKKRRFVEPTAYNKAVEESRKGLTSITLNGLEKSVVRISEKHNYISVFHYFQKKKDAPIYVINSSEIMGLSRIGLELVIANHKKEGQAFTIIINWDGFTKAEQVQLKSVLDKKSNLFGLDLPDNCQIIGVTKQERLPEPVESRLQGPPRLVDDPVLDKARAAAEKLGGKEIVDPLEINLYESPDFMTELFCFKEGAMRLRLNIKEAMEKGRDIVFINPPKISKYPDAYRRFNDLKETLNQAKMTGGLLLGNITCEQQGELIVEETRVLSYEKYKIKEISAACLAPIVIDNDTSLCELDCETQESVSIFQKGRNVLLISEIYPEKFAQIMDLAESYKCKVFCLPIAPPVQDDISPESKDNIGKHCESILKTYRLTDGNESLWYHEKEEHKEITKHDSVIQKELLSGNSIVLTGEINPSLWGKILQHVHLSGQYPGKVKLKDATVNGHPVSFSDPSSWRVKGKKSKKANLGYWAAEKFCFEDWFIEKNFESATQNISEFLASEAKKVLVITYEEFLKNPLLQAYLSDERKPGDWIFHEGRSFAILPGKQIVIFHDRGGLKLTSNEFNFVELKTNEYRIPYVRDWFLQKFDSASDEKKSQLAIIVDELLNKVILRDLISLKTLQQILFESEETGRDLFHCALDTLADLCDSKKKDALKKSLAPLISASASASASACQHDGFSVPGYHLLNDGLATICRRIYSSFSEGSPKKVVLVEGQPGIGKSTLLEGLCQKAKKTRLTVHEIIKKHDVDPRHYVILDEWNEEVLEKSRVCGATVVFNELNLHPLAEDFIHRVEMSGNTHQSFRMLASQNHFGSAGALYTPPQTKQQVHFVSLPLYGKEELMEYWRLNIGDLFFEEEDVRVNVDAFLGDPLTKEDFRCFLSMMRWAQKEQKRPAEAEVARIALLLEKLATAVAEQKDAATRIQSFFRGYKTRKALYKVKKSAAQLAPEPEPQLKETLAPGR